MPEESPFASELQAIRARIAAAAANPAELEMLERQYGQRIAQIETGIAAAEEAARLRAASQAAAEAKAAAKLAKRTLSGSQPSTLN